MGSEECVWTKANLQKLLSEIKANIPESQRKSNYLKSMRSIDWNKVAFPPHSPETCREKWNTILHKMRKLRSLEELVVEAEDAVSRPKLSSKIHPELPKRPPPPNALYSEENWARFQSEHPEFSTAQLLKLASTKYKSLSETKQAPYIKKFKLANEEYDRRMQEFWQQYGKTRRVRRRKRSSARYTTEGEDEGGPPQKPPINGYNLFCRESVISKDDVSGSTNVKIWAQRWRELDQKERKSYSQRCDEMRRRFVAEMQTYLERFDVEEQQNIIRKQSQCVDLRRMEASELRFPNKKPSQAGNSAFFRRQMELLKDEIPDSKKRFAEIGRMWRKLSVKEKHVYKGQVTTDTRKYYEELQHWVQALPEKEQDVFQSRHPEVSPAQLRPRPYKKDSDAPENSGDGGKQRVYQASDSEDEEMESSSSSSDEDVALRDASEDDGEQSGSAFDMF